MGEDHRIIDPESLLLVTTRFGRYDSRLLDEVIDWLSTNGTRINLQRLRRIHDEWPVAEAACQANTRGSVSVPAFQFGRTSSVIFPPPPRNPQPPLFFLEVITDAFGCPQMPANGGEKFKTAGKLPEATLGDSTRAIKKEA